MVPPGEQAARLEKTTAGSSSRAGSLCPGLPDPRWRPEQFGDDPPLEPGGFGGGSTKGLPALFGVGLVPPLPGIADGGSLADGGSPCYDTVSPCCDTVIGYEHFACAAAECGIVVTYFYVPSCLDLPEPSVERELPHSGCLYDGEICGGTCGTSGLLSPSNVPSTCQPCAAICASPRLHRSQRLTPRTPSSPRSRRS